MLAAISKLSEKEVPKLEFTKGQPKAGIYEQWLQTTGIRIASWHPLVEMFWRMATQSVEKAYAQPTLSRGLW